MKKASSVLCALVFLLMFLCCVTCISGSRKGSLFPDMLVNNHGGGLKLTSTSRSLKVISGYKHKKTGNVNLDDYRSYDPTPSSKATVRPGPIEHNAPLIPYIPNPSFSPPPSPPPLGPTGSP